MGEVRTTTGEALPATTREKRIRLRRNLIVSFLVLTAMILVGFQIRLNRYVTAAGYVTTEEYAEVRPSTTGIVTEICVSSGTKVEKGDLLVQLDAAEEKSMVEESRRQVVKLEAEIARRETEISEQKRLLAEGIATARLRLEYASSRLARTKELLAKGLVAGSALEDEQLKEDLARAELTSLLNRNQDIYVKELLVLRRNLEAQQEAVIRAETRIRTKEVRAPVSGVVLRYEFVLGELVRPESVLMEIFGGSQQVLKVRVPERSAARVQLGASYKARLTPFGGLKRIWFRGKVEALRDVIQSEGQTSYRVVYCSFAPGHYTVPPGTTAEVEINWGRVNFWVFLLGLE